MLYSQILCHFLNAFNPILLNNFTVICFYLIYFAQINIIHKLILTISEVSQILLSLMATFYKALMLVGHYEFIKF